MTILSTKNIVQRILEGLEGLQELEDLEKTTKERLPKLKENLDRIKEKISPTNSTNLNDKLAKEILRSDEEKHKFSEIFKIEPQDIRRIAKKCKENSMEGKEEKSKKCKFPILFDSFDIVKDRPANIDLRLGDQYFVSREKYPKNLTETGGFVVIEPGDFAILTTHEYMYVPDDLLGLISLRNTYKKLGIINISGFHVDPGYVGRLFFSVYNSGPEKVVLKHKEPVFMIMFDELKEPVLNGYGEGKENITTDLISGLIGYSISPTRLKTRIDSLEMYLRILLGVVIALLVAVFAQLLKT